MASEISHRVWINARFIDRPTTGVERVAREVLSVIASQMLDEDGCWMTPAGRCQMILVAPKGGSTTSPWPNLPLRRLGSFDGHAWEQFSLPLITRGEWLISLCNTGPLIKRKQIIYLHDAQPFVIGENFSFPFRTWYRVLYSVAGRCSQHILVNSEFTRAELNRCIGLNIEKMQRCGPGVEHMHRLESSTKELADLGLTDKPFILAVSSANPNKNFRAVVEATRQLGDDAPMLVIVGQRVQGHFSPVELESERIQHLGFVSDELLVALYRQAVCLVFPSYYEGFGLPPVEAMSQGCPVIASNRSAMPEVCGDAAVFIDPDDPGSLATAMVAIQEDETLREALRRKGLQNIERHSWKKSAESLLNLTTEAATSHARDSEASSSI
ncbi:MAG: glycosyltransferase family 1 protein [Pseudomonadota bacterium]